MCVWGWGGGLEGGHNGENRGLLGNYTSHYLINWETFSSSGISSDTKPSLAGLYCSLVVTRYSCVSVRVWVLWAQARV